MGEATLRTIQRIDAVCDCIPVVSILTNGAQLLYKAARKVDATANPIPRGWKGDLKIHVISKPSWECRYCMIPFAGNLTSLIMRIIEGLKDHIITAVCCDNTEVVKLALANGHLNDPERARRILGQAVFSSNLETFNLIFSSRNWSQSEVIDALSWRIPNDSDELKMNFILGYYKARGFDRKELTDREIGEIIKAFASYVKANRSDTADRILGILPKCEFGKFSQLLQNSAFVYQKSYGSDRPKGRLSEDQIDQILNLCESCTWDELREYCEEIGKEANNLKSDLKNRNATRRYFYVLIEIAVRDFYGVHSKIIKKLLDHLEDDCDGLTEIFSLLSNHGQVQFLELFLNKYEERLLAEDKLKALKGTRESKYLYPNSILGFMFLFDRFESDLSDDECLELYGHFTRLDMSNEYTDYISEKRPATSSAVS